MVGRRFCAANPIIRSRRVSKKGAAVTSNAPTRCSTSEFNAALSSTSSFARATKSCWLTAFAAGSRSSNSCTVGGNLGFIRIPISATFGTSSRSKPSRFDSISWVQSVKPVTLPPGRLKLATRPALTGSHPKHDRDRRGCFGGGDSRNITTDTNQNSHLVPDQLGGQSRQPVIIALRPTELNLEILPFDKTAFSEALLECRDEVNRVLR